MNRTECYLVLNRIRAVGPVRVRKLKEVFGSVEEILATPTKHLAAVEGVGQAVAESIAGWRSLKFDPARELDEVARLGAQVVDCEDASYPPSLAEIYDPPLVLYVRGAVEVLSKRGIAVIGSRRVSPYGIETAKKLSYQLAYVGFVVISGLARGIDACAHQGALASKGRTVGVLGSALDQFYPRENEVLAEKMVEQAGAVVSEFPLGTAPDRQTFPMRNRIVSGLSTGVLVVEAAAGSGALITARMALEQGRAVYAVPGRIDSAHSAGCHRLIKDGAKLVEGVEDILGDLEFLFPPQELKSSRPWPEDLSREERSVMEALGLEEMHLDQIIAKCGLPSPVASSTLLRLEMRRLVKQLPGKYFVKTD